LTIYEVFGSYLYSTNKVRILARSDKIVYVIVRCQRSEFVARQYISNQAEAIYDARDMVW
jgi:RNase P/RNase MRP subunit POP5